MPCGCTEEALEVVLDHMEKFIAEAVEQFYVYTSNPDFARSDVEAQSREIVDYGMHINFDREYSSTEE